ncbi:FAD-dependent oxidoreductase [Bradyrhizobium canariense]|uniref:FAD-dependent oxidoreductase n=2 Tax=Bradyrhizobium canariense TaxID=255045 RepID=A0A1X3G7J8_9BRAD|nr:FAD-dependent oxidoreductase [Bradyrhizobium canariense]OSI82518.1 FAD-dependent oxidoreductase [Bradyrhizobium canariense]OSI96998.1 FAD-dependent oxidoreductase [Bradyrhizobium canariense]OSI99653.1 FAD-dependent oxidoreductase [Bradyrhizobium canariense]OSJ16734.1 FAD-dependent oxidoreductase [Bradyrhizobium canariense]
MLPTSVEQVSELIKLGRSLGIAIVPQAGNTGMTGGAVPINNRPSMILNVSKLNRVRDIDSQNNSVIVEAGCILATLRESLEPADKLFPMLLGSVGSCQIGGLVSTNAGGINVLRYGNMRELVLGLEVVLPNGKIWNGLKVLRKDNSGYDLKQLFIGAEGTLGVVTAAALKLFPKPTNTGTAMVALPSMQSAVDLLRVFADGAAGKVEAFEIISKGQLENVLLYHKELPPMPLSSPWYVMIELADSSINWDPNQVFEQILTSSIERGLIHDAVIASDSKKAERLWRLRHTISEANMRKGFSVANDTSVPISKIAVFIEQVDQRLKQEFKAADVYYAGHVGDGNIHVIIVFDRGLYDTDEKRETAAARANFIVHEASVELDGSISAEHGVGLMHIEELERFKSDVDLEMMAQIKRAFDPDNIMNPGKVLAAARVVAARKMAI